MSDHPGRFLRELLDSKGWTHEELAAITGYSRQTIASIIAGRSRITPDVAVTFAAAFGNTPDEWLRWDADHQLSLVSSDAAGVAGRARLYNLAPIREMQRRGWIREAQTTSELEAELESFFGGALDGVAFRVATLRRSDAQLTPAEKAWCFKARQLAESLAYVAPFDASRLAAAEKKLRQLAAFEKETERLAEILAYYGIRFVVVEPIAGAAIDGAAFWIDGSPVIAVSLRWDRIDAFWFTVFHEFMHIRNGDASVDVDLLRAGENGISIAVATDAAERLANESAAHALVPRAELDSFVRSTSPLYAATRIIQFAHVVKMHPGIIVGQLQHRGELKYSAHRSFLVKVRKYVVETALTDGWGRTIGSVAPQMEKPRG